MRRLASTSFFLAAFLLPTLVGAEVIRRVPLAGGAFLYADLGAF